MEKVSAVTRAAAEIAFKEAIVLHDIARSVDNTLTDPGDTEGRPLAAAVNIGLAIELYLKTFMIWGRPEGMSTGHNLKALYEELPLFLTNEIERRYKAHPLRKKKMQLIAYKLSEERPGDPNKEIPNFNPDNIKSVLDQIKGMFTEARYFFQHLSDENWIIFKYYMGPAFAIAEPLRDVFIMYRDNGFRDS